MNIFLDVDSEKVRDIEDIVKKLEKNQDLNISTRNLLLELKQKQHVSTFYPICKKASVSSILIHPNELFVQIADGIFLKKTAQQSADFISQKLLEIKELLLAEKEKLNVLKEKMKNNCLKAFEDENGFYNIVEYENENDMNQVLNSESLQLNSSTNSNNSSTNSNNSSVKNNEEKFQDFLKVMERLIKEEEEEGK
jgi:hypothetical protein